MNGNTVVTTVASALAGVGASAALYVYARAVIVTLPPWVNVPEVPEIVWAESGYAATTTRKPPRITRLIVAMPPPGCLLVSTGRLAVPNAP